MKKSFKIFCLVIISFGIFISIMELPSILYWSISHITKYLWFLGGILLYFLTRMIPAVKQNEGLFQTFSHELSHTVVGLLFLRKIHSFKATDRDGGEIWHSGRSSIGESYITLAPYCLPLGTYIFLLLGLFWSNSTLAVLHLFVGYTLAFHILCFYTQLSPSQSDIKKFGNLFSYLFILFFWIFNLSVILVSIRYDIIEAFGTLLGEYWHNITSLIGLFLS